MQLLLFTIVIILVINFLGTSLVQHSYLLKGTIIDHLYLWVINDLQAWTGHVQRSTMRGKASGCGKVLGNLETQHMIGPWPRAQGTIVMAPSVLTKSLSDMRVFRGGVDRQKLHPTHLIYSDIPRHFSPHVDVWSMMVRRMGLVHPDWLKEIVASHWDDRWSAGCDKQSLMRCTMHDGN
jgi:hypothetical protein